MRFATLKDLRASNIYQSLASLQKMPVFRQMRFLEVFNKVWKLATQRGAKEDVADANAAAIAIMAAESYTPTPASASLEKEEHYFATMTEFQYSLGGKVEINDFSFVLANLDLVNAAVAGNAFNLNHEHTEPTGIVRRLAKPEDVPESVRAKFPDAPFFTVASYYEDTPEPIRAIQTVSAEWRHSKAAADGSTRVILPETFALTENPATPELLGVGKAAGLALDDKSFQAKSTVEGSRVSMPGELEQLQSTVASLQKEAEASKTEFEAKLTEAEQKYAGLEKNYKDVLAKVASLSGAQPAKGKEVSEDAALKALETRYASLQSTIDEMKAEAQQKEADAWADKVVKTKEIAVDAKPKLAALHLTAKKAALELEASLPNRVLQPGQTDAKFDVTKLSAEQQKAHLDFIAAGFGGGKR